MRTRLILLVLFITGYNSYAGTSITPNKAKTVAETYYRSSTNYVNAVGKISQTDKDDNGNVLFYIVDMDKSGFVIVSGTTVTHPIIAISTSGNYKPIPNSGVKDYLYNLHNHIAQLYKIKITQAKDIAAEWEELANGLSINASRSSSGVSPLLSTTWNQSPYYNDYCPGGSVTGCVATAMAQIVKYWNYPSSGTGSYSYSDPPYGTLSSSFDSTISWSIMPASLSSSTAQNEIDAVASLMYKLGVSVAMSYSPSGSGAYVLQSENPGGPCAQASYVSYFGYNANTIQGSVQSNYTTTKWDSIINVELNNKRPIEYVGFGTDGGHTWVLDGYNSSGLYDMNWGWGGLDDGYFALNNLDPSGIPLGSDNAMLIGIEPGTGTTCSEPTSVTASSITDSSAVITWAGSGSPQSYNLNYQLSGASSWTSVTGITSASYTLKKLSAGSTYNIEVQQVCSSTESSSFTTTLSFNTTALPTCSEPTSVIASSITDSSALISWIGSGSPKSYTLNYQVSGATSWTTVSDIASPSYSLKKLTAGTTYNIQIQQVCSNNESSSFTNTLSFSTLTNTITYCTSSGTTSSEYIKSVVFGSIDNTVSNDGGYHNYTSLSTNITAGTSYKMTVTPGFTGSAYTEYWSIFIDYDHTGNMVLVREGRGMGSITGSITVPTTSVNGSTRMRIVMHRGNYDSDPCGSFTDGDVQDYTVVISGGTSSIALDNNGAIVNDAVDGISAKIYPNPVNTTLNINYLNDVEVKNIMLVDAMGRILLQSQSKMEAIDVSKYPQGWYILVINGNDGSTLRKMIMVSR